tara:strand:+ start:228 stop:386 length:159 start_codon:yes stop_codon:yes gene_type:complete
MLPWMRRRRVIERGSDTAEKWRRGAERWRRRRGLEARPGALTTILLNQSQGI